MDLRNLIDLPTGPELFGRYDYRPHSKVFGRPMTQPEICEIREGIAQLDYVYFISAPALDVIKIGYSSQHPDRRLSGLRGGSPCPLEPLGIIRGDRSYEKALHDVFEPLCSHCEWFRAAPALLDFIARYALPWPDPRDEPVWVDRGVSYERYSAFFNVLDVWGQRRIRPLFGWPLPEPTAEDWR